MRISILQWNIWFQEDIHNIVRYLKTNPADVICLQELIINHPEQTEVHTPSYIAEQLDYHYFAPEMDLHDGIKIADGIFTRFPIKKTKQVWINEPMGNGGYDDEYRVYAQAELKIDDKLLTVGTTHMSYTHRFEVSDRKRQETDKLTKCIKEVDGSYVLTGDFNATPSSYVVEEISRRLNHSGPDFDEPSWTTKPFDYNGFKETELKWRLDYVFASKDLNILSSKIETTEFSDHLPVRIEIEL